MDIIETFKSMDTLAQGVFVLLAVLFLIVITGSGLILYEVRKGGKI